jgi:hypothetical protein
VLIVVRERSLSPSFLLIEENEALVATVTIYTGETFSCPDYGMLTQTWKLYYNPFNAFVFKRDNTPSVFSLTNKHNPHPVYTGLRNRNKGFRHVNGVFQSFEFSWTYNAIGELKMSWIVLFLLCTVSVCVCMCMWEITMTGLPEVVEDHSIHLCFLLDHCTQLIKLPLDLNTTGIAFIPWNALSRWKGCFDTRLYRMSSCLYHSDLSLQITVVAICTTCFNIKTTVHFAHSVRVCFVWLSE